MTLIRLLKQEQSQLFSGSFGKKIAKEVLKFHGKQPRTKKSRAHLQTVVDDDPKE